MFAELSGRPDGPLDMIGWDTVLAGSLSGKSSSKTLARHHNASQLLRA